MAMPPPFSPIVGGLDGRLAAGVEGIEAAMLCCWCVRGEDKLSCGWRQAALFRSLRCAIPHLDS